MQVRAFRMLYVLCRLFISYAFFHLQRTIPMDAERLRLATLRLICATRSDVRGLPRYGISTASSLQPSHNNVSLSCQNAGSRQERLRIIPKQRATMDEVITLEMKHVVSSSSLPVPEPPDVARP